MQTAISKRLQQQACRAFANLYSIYCAQRRFAEAERYFVDGVAYCTEHDISTFGRCLRGERAGAMEKVGRWDESVALSLELMRDAGASLFNRVNPLISLGKIRARRGETGVWDCLDEATAAAAGSGEPQWIVAARST